MRVCIANVCIYVYINIYITNRPLKILCIYLFWLKYVDLVRPGPILKLAQINPRSLSLSFPRSKRIAEKQIKNKIKEEENYKRQKQYLNNTKVVFDQNPQFSETLV